MWPAADEREYQDFMSAWVAREPALTQARADLFEAMEFLRPRTRSLDEARSVYNAAVNRMIVLGLEHLDIALQEVLTEHLRAAQGGNDAHHPM